MSDPSNPFRDPIEPLKPPDVTGAQIVHSPFPPQPPKRSIFANPVFWITITLGVVGVLALGGLVIGMVLARLVKNPDEVTTVYTDEVIGEDERPTSYKLRSPVGEPPVYAASYEAGPLARTAHPDYDSIMEFGRALSDVAKYRPTPELLELLDVERSVLEAKQIYIEKLAGKEEDVSWVMHVKRQRTRAVGPLPFDEFLIFRIDDLSEDERLVWVHHWKNNVEVLPVRWWLKRHRNGWRLYDWQFVGGAIRESHSHAVLWSMRDPYQIEGHARYLELTDQYMQEYNPNDPRFRARATKILEECENLVVPDELAPTVLLAIASRWYYAGELRRCLVSLEKFEEWHPFLPAAYWLKGRIRSMLGEHEQALEDLKKFRYYLGPTSTSLTIEARCLENLGRFEEALDVRRKLATIEGRYESTNLSRLLTRVDSKEGLEILESVADRPHALPVLESLTLQLGKEFVASREIELVREVLERRYPKSTAALLAGAVSECYTGDLDAGIDRLAQAITVSHQTFLDEEQIALEPLDSLRYRVVVAFAFQLASRFDRVIDLCERSADDPNVFEYFYKKVVERDTPWATSEALLAVTTIREKAAPGDLEAIAWKGIALGRLQRWQQAIDTLAPAMTALQQRQPYDYGAQVTLAESYMHLRDYARMKKWVTSERVARWLLWRVDDYGDFEAAREILSTLAPTSWVRRAYGGWVDFHAGKTRQATQAFLDVLQSENAREEHWLAETMLLRLVDEQGTLLNLLDVPLAAPVYKSMHRFLSEIHDWKRLGQMTAHFRQTPLEHGTASRGHVKWQNLQLDLLLSQRRYAEGVEFAVEWGPDAGKRDSLSDAAAQHAMSAALKIGRWDAVEKLMEGISDPELVLLWKARLALWQGKTEELKGMYGQLTPEAKRKLGDDLVLRGGPFVPFLYSSAPRLNQFSRSVNVTVLLSEELDVSTIVDRPLLQRVFGKETPIEILQIDSKRNEVLIRVPPYRVSIMAGQADCSQVNSLLDKIKEAAAKTTHVAQIAVVMDDLPDREEDEDWRAFLLSQELSTPRFVALVIGHTWLMADELPADGNRIAIFRKAYWTPAANAVPTIRRDKVTKEARAQAAQSLNDALRQAEISGYSIPDAESATDSAGGLHVFADCRFGATLERLEFRVLMVKRLPFSEPELLTTLVTESKWNPHLRVDLPVRMRLSEVVGFELQPD